MGNSGLSEDGRIVPHCKKAMKTELKCKSCGLDLVIESDLKIKIDTCSKCTKEKK